MKLHGEELTEGQEVAMRALLDIAADRAIRPSARIGAACAVLFPNDPERAFHVVGEDEGPAAGEAADELYDAIAERVIVRLTPVLEQLRREP